MTQRESLGSVLNKKASLNFLSDVRDLINNKILVTLTAFSFGSGINTSLAQQNLPPTYNTDYEAMGYIGQAPNTAIIEMFFVDQNHIHPSSIGYKFDYGSAVYPLIITPTPVSIVYELVDPDGQYADKYRVTIEGVPGVEYHFSHLADRPGGSGNMFGSIRFDANGKPIFLNDLTAPNIHEQQDFINIPRLVSTTTTDAPCPLGYGNFTIDLAALASSDTAWQEPLDPDNAMTVVLTDNTGVQYTQTFPQGMTSATLQVPAGTYTGLEVNGYDFSNSPYFNNQVVCGTPTSLSQLSWEEEVSIYPNPVIANEIYIKGLENQNFDYKITNSVGMLVAEGVNNNGSVNIENLSSGIYFIQITPDVILRFVK